MASVRRATEADLDAMIAMGQALHDESPRYAGMAFSPDKLRRLWAQLQGTLLAESDRGCVFVAEEGGEVVGMTVGIAAERWFSEERYLTDLTLYVQPAHRGGTAFRRLVGVLERWAAEQGLDQLALGVSTEIHPERTVRAYERLGYRLAGYTMVKQNGN
ncbi:GNAT family N-acetyltransferase [Variovorax sp. J31P207]|uniref:GNAT family N-acetyltransferase n=1 Tax=Variovorax sp. J31P207 TaxID=3053510 RepID=UPI0025781C31|nr:GNAT family N-acetyltransferase [Variovorax sp. J31P207]MDM0072079.1 GNAT family N-acetyltransferase [Variovorax sp. J31P207]